MRFFFEKSALIYLKKAHHLVAHMNHLVLET